MSTTSERLSAALASAAPDGLHFSHPILAIEDQAIFEKIGYWLPWTLTLLSFPVGKWSKHVRRPAVLHVRRPGLLYVNHYTRIEANPFQPQLIREDFSRALIPAQPTNGGPVPTLQLTSGWIRYVVWRESRHLVDLSGTFEDYLSAFGGKARKNIRREVKIFQDLCGGSINWRRFSSPDEMIAFQKIAAEISSKTYKAGIGATFQATPEFAAELRMRAQRGQCRGYVLYHADKPVAYIYCRPHFGVLIYHHVAHDPYYNRWSPGKVLLYLVLEALFAEKAFHYLDFSETEYWYKAFYATNTTPCARVLYLRLSVTNAALVLSHWIWVSALRTGALAKRKLRHYAKWVIARPAKIGSD